MGPLNKVGNVCVSFAYHMYGYHINKLELMKVNAAGGQTSQWNKMQDQGNRWMLAEVTVDLVNIDDEVISWFKSFPCYEPTFAW